MFRVPAERALSFPGPARSTRQPRVGHGFTADIPFSPRVRDWRGGNQGQIGGNREMRHSN